VDSFYPPQALYAMLKDWKDIREEHNEDLKWKHRGPTSFQSRAEGLPQPDGSDELIAEGLAGMPTYLVSQLSTPCANHNPRSQRR